MPAARRSASFDRGQRSALVWRLVSRYCRPCREIVQGLGRAGTVPLANRLSSRAAPIRMQSNASGIAAARPRLWMIPTALKSHGLRAAAGLKKRLSGRIPGKARGKIACSDGRRLRDRRPFGETIVARLSAGLLMYRVQNGAIQVLLAHPGGPYFRNKDEGAWSIPKGEPEEGEDLLATAEREFEEETGVKPRAPCSTQSISRRGVNVTPGRSRATIRAAIVKHLHNGMPHSASQFRKSIAPNSSISTRRGKRSSRGRMP